MSFVLLGAGRRLRRCAATILLLKLTAYCLCCAKIRRSYSHVINYGSSTIFFPCFHWWRQLPFTKWLPLWSYVQSLHWIQFFVFTIESANNIDMVVSSGKARCCIAAETNRNDLVLKVVDQYRKFYFHRKWKIFEGYHVSGHLSCYDCLI